MTVGFLFLPVYYCNTMLSPNPDVVALWEVSLPDGIHLIEFEHETTSGRRVVRYLLISNIETKNNMIAIKESTPKKSFAKTGCSSW